MTLKREPDPWPIIEWLAENFPRALEMCPYKVPVNGVVYSSRPPIHSSQPLIHEPRHELGGESVSREARGLEQRNPDGGAGSVSNSPPSPFDASSLEDVAVSARRLLDVRGERWSVAWHEANDLNAALARVGMRTSPPDGSDELPRIMGLTPPQKNERPEGRS